MRFLKSLAFLGCCLLTSLSFGQDYVLENPADPAGASTAVVTGEELTVVDATGRRFNYTRRPDMDSKDGRYVAFFSLDANQFLRWPVKNTGNLEIGRVQRGVMTWTPSRMEIRPLAPPPGPAFVAGSPLHIATLPLGPATVCAAQIDATGTLQFFIGHGERWRHVPSAHPPGLFIPGAPLHLVADPTSAVPRVYTVSVQGKFVEVRGGKVSSDLPGPTGIAFFPGSQFEVLEASSTSTYVFATDNKGRLWRLDVIGGGPHQMIESKPGKLEPGVPLQLMREGHEVLVIDRRGALVLYSLDPLETWHGPEFLADGFVSNGAITAWTRPGGTVLEIAAVDRAGRMQVLRSSPMGWNQDTIPSIVLPPGTPVTALPTSEGLSLTAVLADGRWMEFFESAGLWSQRELGTGFPARAPLAAADAGPMLFASDLTGRLIAAMWFGSEWRTFVCVPGYFSGTEPIVAPRLVSRKFLTNRPLNAAAVTFRNTTNEELVIRMSDNRVPGKIDEIRLQPDSEQLIQADRDAGGTLEEVYLVPGPLGPVEEVRRIPLPPKQFYDVVVYASRVTYRYVDKRKKKGPLPDFEESSLTSIGAFPLAPGDALLAGTVLDVFQIASDARNPGAAAVIDPMRKLP